MLRPIRAAGLALLSFLWLVSLAALVPVAAQAGRPRIPPPPLVVTSPANGVFTNAGSVTVTGQALNVNPSTAVRHRERRGGAAQLERDASPTRSP